MKLSLVVPLRVSSRYPLVNPSKILQRVGSHSFSGLSVTKYNHTSDKKLPLVILVSKLSLFRLRIIERERERGGGGSLIIYLAAKLVPNGLSKCSSVFFSKVWYQGLSYEKGDSKVSV